CADHVWGGFKEVAYKTAERSLGWHLPKGSPEDSPLMYEYRSKYKTPKRALQAFEGSIVQLEEGIGKKNAVNKAKLAIFTRLFGGGIPSIMNLLKCSREEAAEFLQEYAEAFPGMEPWMKKVARESRRKGYVKTAFDRWI